MAAPPEVTLFADVLREIQGVDDLKATGSDISKRSASFAHFATRVTGEVDVDKLKISSPYLSQITASDFSGNPSRPKLITGAFALWTIWNEQAHLATQSCRSRIELLLEDLWTQLEVRPPLWGDEYEVLGAMAENCVIPDYTVQLVHRAVASIPAFFSISGPHLSGKSTLLALAEETAYSRGRHRHIKRFSMSTVSEQHRLSKSEVLKEFGRGMGIPAMEEELTPVLLDQAMERFLESQPGDVLVLIDDANLIFDALGGESAIARALWRGWAQRARSASSRSAWRRLSMGISTTFDPNFAGKAALRSESPAFNDFFELAPWDPPRAAELIDVWAARRQVELSINVADWANELVEYTGGSAGLLHRTIALGIRAAESGEVETPPSPNNPMLRELFRATARPIIQAIAGFSSGAPHRTLVGKDGQDGSGDGGWTEIDAPAQVVRALGVAPSSMESIVPWVRDYVLPDVITAGHARRVE